MHSKRAMLTLAALAALLCCPAIGRANDVFSTINWDSKDFAIRLLGGRTANAVYKVTDGTNSAVVKFSFDVPLTINFADRLRSRICVPALPATVVTFFMMRVRTRTPSPSKLLSVG